MEDIAGRCSLKSFSFICLSLARCSDPDRRCKALKILRTDTSTRIPVLPRFEGRSVELEIGYCEDAGRRSVVGGQ